MKTKFWSVYALTMLVLVGGVYFATAKMATLPLVLTDAEMTQLSGALIDWNCNSISPCMSIPCTGNTHTQVSSGSTCTTCEPSTNDTCYPSGNSCPVCFVYTYYSGCSGDFESYSEKYKTCD